jgi:hypothetical protein
MSMSKRRRTHPLVVEVLSYEESDALMREWFESVVFVDGPEEELPELEPEEDDEPRD